MPSRTPLILAVLLLLVSAAPAFAESPATRPASVDHSAFDALLRQYVNADGRVDYLLWRRDDYDALVTYLDQLDAVDPSRLDRNERLALYLNLYNAAMIHVTMDHYNTRWNPKRGLEGGDQEPYAVFNEKVVRTNGQKVSLNELEHVLIRAGFREPLVHAAMVCAARDCPPIRTFAFTGDNVQSAIEQNMRAWVNDAARNEFDAGDKQATFSKLFKFYANDFGGIEDVPAYLARYSDRDLSDWVLEYKPTYNWAPNIAVPASGEWVELTAPVAPDLSAGEVLEVVGREGDRVELQVPRGGPAVWVEASATEKFEPKTSDEM